MSRAQGPSSVTWRRLLPDPLVHFLGLGALLFLVHRLAGGDPRTIPITDGVRADSAQRFADHDGDRPNPAEREKAMRDWKHEEALYREALRLELDREDRTARTVLATRRARAPRSRFHAVSRPRPGSKTGRPRTSTVT